MGHTNRCQLAFKKKKNQVKSPSPESRVPETGSDPPIGSGRDSGLDNVPLTYHQIFSYLTNVEQVDLLSNQLATQQCYQLFIRE